MPYKFEYDHIHLPKDKDRRIKLTDDQREEIRDKYATGNYSTYKLADSYNVSRRTIQFVLDPKKLEESRKRLEERGGSKIYYDTKKNTIAKREHRNYKKQVLEELDKTKDKWWIKRDIKQEII